jgi:hypothetical protein
VTEILTPQFPDDPRKVADGVNADGTLSFRQVGVEQLNYRGRFGATAISNSENTVAVGQHKFVIQDDDNLFRIGDDVLCTSLDNPLEGFFWGEIIAKSSGPTELTVYVDDISSGILTSSNWELQVVARPKFGITKDTSTTSINPTGAGPFTFTVTSGKFFPVGGKLLMIPLADRSIALVGEITAYSGTSLVVTKNATNATVSTSYSAWAIALLDAPQRKIPYYQISGLRISINATDPLHDIDITAGSVRDYTDTVDLVLSASVTKRLDATFVAGTNQGAFVQSANLSGTVSSVGTAVTGTGTAFLTDFTSAAGVAQLLDFKDQYTLWKGATAYSTLQYPSIISAGAVTTSVAASSNTAAVTIGGNLGAAGATYKRGGWPTHDGFLAIVLIRKDSDGSVGVCSCAFNASGTPDLPSGYTYYRVIGAVTVTASAMDSTLPILQPLYGVSSPIASEVSYDNQSGTFTVGNDNAQDAIVTLDTELSNLSAATLTQEAGLYTPTLTNVTNLAASTSASAFYIRIGSIVFVTGAIAVDPTTSAGTATTLRMSLPIASGFASTAQLRGVMTGASNAETGVFTANIANANAQLDFQAQQAVNHFVDFSFAYVLV